MTLQFHITCHLQLNTYGAIQAKLLLRIYNDVSILYFLFRPKVDFLPKINLAF